MKLAIHCSKNLDKGNDFSTPLSTSVTTLLLRFFSSLRSFTLNGALRNVFSKIACLYAGKLTLGLVTSLRSTDSASIDSSSPKVRSSSNSITSFLPSHLMVKFFNVNNVLNNTLYINVCLRFCCFRVMYYYICRLSLPSNTFKYWFNWLYSCNRVFCW